MTSLKASGALLREIPMLRAGEPLKCLLGTLGDDLSEESAIASARGQCDLLLLEGEATPATVGWTDISLRSFRFPVLPRPSLRLLYRRFRRPFELGRTITQNEFEVLKQARKEGNRGAAELIVLEEQGNIVWGYRRSGQGKLGGFELEVGGLVLNRPHFYPVLLERLLIEHKILLLRGVLPASSPLMGYVNVLEMLAGEQAPIRAWSAPEGLLAGQVDGLSQVHLFLPETEDVSG